MRKLKWFITTALVCGLLHGCSAGDRGNRVASCGGSHRLRIVTLRMSPDPLGDRQYVDAWWVGLQSDGSGECRTTIRIREERENTIVGREKVFRLRPGYNEISIEPSASYRFRRREHCFTVLADIAGTVRPVDASRAFCARTVRDHWTMK